MSRSRSVLITGANGSLAIPAIDHLLPNHPEITAILTVRNPDSSKDPNTKRLEDIIARHGAKDRTSIHTLDLTDLSSVKSFCESISSQITSGKLPPLSSIICNAYHWNLVANPELTPLDGYEKTMQVNHLSQAALVLRLLGNFAPAPEEAQGGRVVFFSSDAHWPGKNMFEKYPPGIPSSDEEMDELVQNTVFDNGRDKAGRGFQRYAVSKLVVTMWMSAINSRLEKDPSLSHITAIAINPGNLVDSRATRTNTPAYMGLMTKALAPLLPIIRLKDQTARKAAAAGADVIDLALNKTSPGERGFFTMNKKDVSSPDSLDREKQERVWRSTLGWIRLGKGETVLKGLD
ncbi:short-chain dehydrogenase [Naviculisporaceae sp. PSN 640]